MVVGKRESPDQVRVSFLETIRDVGGIDSLHGVKVEFFDPILADKAEEEFFDHPRMRKEELVCLVIIGHGFACGHSLGRFEKRLPKKCGKGGRGTAPGGRGTRDGEGRGNFSATVKKRYLWKCLAKVVEIHRLTI